MTDFNLAAARPEIADAGRIRLGAALKRPAVRAAVADAGKIRLGAALKRTHAAR